MGERIWEKRDGTLGLGGKIWETGDRAWEMGWGPGDKGRGRETRDGARGMIGGGPHRRI